MVMYVTYLKEVSVFIVSAYYLSMYFNLYLPPLFFIIGDIPSGETGLTLSILKQQKPNLRNERSDKLPFMMFDYLNYKQTYSNNILL